MIRSKSLFPLSKKTICFFFICFSILSISSASGTDIFINKVWYLQETNNFYTKLHLKKELADSISTDEIKDQLDSTVFKKYYLTRRRLPHEIAQQYFDLSALSEIEVYDIDHGLITSASLLRVEYYEDMIEGMFIAVFKNTTPIELEDMELDFYALSKSAATYLEKGFKQSEVTKNQWDKAVKNKVPFDKDDLLKNYHMEIKSNGHSKFTILSLQKKNDLNYSTYLMEHEDDSIQIHWQKENDFVFWDIIPVPLLKNNKPILLLEIIIPDTDFTGYVLAEYDGFKYLINHEMVTRI